MKTKCLMYCTKALPNLYKLDENEFYTDRDTHYNGLALNGKIVAECEVETEELTQLGCGEPMLFTTKTLDSLEVCKRSCLKTEELSDYLYNQDKDSKGYALHISNLKIFDKPKELDDFTTRTPVEYDSIVCDSCTELNCDCKKCRYYYDYRQVIKAPQNMMKVCEWDLEDKVLISIKPKWLCKILNGEKTIEVRRKVLKGMVE